MSSPAYDLVTPAGRERLAAADPHNIVRLILPHVEQDNTLGGDPVLRSAEQAGRTLRTWVESGVLQQDPEPALWLYELQPGDGTPATVGWVGAVGLPPAGSRAVLPHEDTYPPAVEGRRALLQATGTDLEPIVLAHDPEPVVGEVTRRAREADPTIEVPDTDGVRHRLWRVTDQGLLAALQQSLARTGAVIADGHHRFAAAWAHSSSHPDAPGSDEVLALLTPMGPGGLRVEGIHRVVPELSLADARAAAAAGFRVEELPAPGGGPAAAVRSWLQDSGASGVVITDGRRVFRLDEPAEHVRATVPAEAPAAWRGLDVVLVHHGLLQHLWRRSDDPTAVLIAHDLGEALQTAAERAGVAVVLRAPAPTDVAAVARAGARMPRKSTLFVPKPRTGLILRPHAG